MRVFFDTSVLVAALVRSHPRHAPARAWLGRAVRGEVAPVVAAHSLAELHATLTRLPLRPRISPATAVRLRHENLPPETEVVALSAEDYEAVLSRMAELGLAGGIIYDALLARAAEKADVERLLTFNERDFLRAWPEGAERVARP